MNNMVNDICCLLIGSPTVGKSTLAIKFANGVPSNEYQMSTRVNLYSKNYMHTNSRLQLQVVLLDCPGRPIYQQLVQQTARRLEPRYVVIVAMFDVTNRASMTGLETMLSLFNKSNGGKASTEPMGILLANKVDLLEKRIISSQEGQQKAKMLKYRYLECSALADLTVHEFDQLLADIVHSSLSPSSTDTRLTTAAVAADKSAESNDKTTSETLTKN